MWSERVGWGDTIQALHRIVCGSQAASARP